LAQIEEDYLTPDEETEVQRKRRKANKRKALSRFNAELRRQAHAEWKESEQLRRQAHAEWKGSEQVLGEELDEERKQNHARTAQTRAVLSDEDRLYIQELDRKQKARQQAHLKNEVQLYLVYKTPCSLMPTSFARHQQPSGTKTMMQSVQEIYISVRDSTVSVFDDSRYSKDLCYIVGLIYMSKVIKHIVQLCVNFHFPSSEFSKASYTLV
jgi:hypothetical protein